ncbi:hypothetical protein FQN57_007360 [Myotisia sp. PD_48]|nr:hypothetical protein FQN57_007360 [Myotisia sp. PD_48]
MPPRGFTNPAPKTESARSALNAFHCSLCNKSYSRHPEYEAHISSYDHQHKKRLRDLKQLSRDPNAAEKARKAERKANAEAGLISVDAADPAKRPSTTTAGGAGAIGGGFKKGGFKSSFSVISGNAGAASGVGQTASVPRLKKNILGDAEDEDQVGGGATADANHPKASSEPQVKVPNAIPKRNNGAESDTEEEYGNDDLEAGGGYYDPRKPTGCSPDCAGTKVVTIE